MLEEPEEDHKGNWGSQDQVAALQWLHNFMPHFGADQNQVTLAGCSAGGGSQGRSNIHAKYLTKNFPQKINTSNQVVHFTGRRGLALFPTRHPNGTRCALLWL